MPVANWASWKSDNNELAVTDVSFVAPLLRRRLSHLAKMTLRVAHDCTQGLSQVRFVFSSRHGDLTRTTAMLDDIAEKTHLSPTVFSLSVLNAGTGLFSILRNDTSPATAISAGESSFGFGLIEAAMQFAEDPDTPVLYVYADEPAPAIYGSVERSGAPAHALAVLLDNDSAIRLDCRMNQTQATDSAEVHSLAFLYSLSNGNTGVWNNDGQCWSWTDQ